VERRRESGSRARHEAFGKAKSIYYEYMEMISMITTCLDELADSKNEQKEIYNGS
jgi:hypothetical protein